MSEPVRSKPFNVLFLCTGNSARSIMAEAIINRVGYPNFKGYSAGSHPKGEINPKTAEILSRNAYRPSDYRSKSWEEFTRPDAPDLDFVFTVCDDAASEVCPVWPGQPMTAHWGIPDPAAAVGNEAEIMLAFSEAFRILDNRIGLFTSLPIDKLDKLSLQKRLEEIGKSNRAAQKV